ncbi:MFS transporter [Verrucomicrobiaceae bacterium 5K15]|uniref:MFS transporter n=1 Tax=Oceaniferula flava TaxID=2800421 RepID=A0AAE2V9Q6_9BACT|nr:MFS transporter [Oceaniferula flavus]MBK1855568.1 MFS transporter [Oceaniferula flavus]MBM1136874.1 MFS transporter [Oceaniferula flavus]
MSTAKNSNTLRLSVMMFLQFFVWGAWYVAMWGFLKNSGMTAIGNGGSFDAAAYTVAPIAAILAPLTLGLIADRFLNTEKVLSILFLVGAILLYIAPSLAQAGAPESFLGQFSHPMILCLLAYMICFMPTLGLTASLSFSHLENAEKQFPVVRVMGTIGWIVGNWAMWLCRSTGLDADVFSDNSPHIFTAAALASGILGLYCLTLPKTTPPSKGKKIALGEIVGIDAWGLLKNKGFFVFAIASFLICIPLAGYYAKGYGYVDSMGVTLFGSTTGAMSTGQMSEIFFMLVMPFCFARLGVKWMLTIGMAAWVARYGLWGYAFGQEGPMLTLPIFIGILLHGICYDFFFVTGMIYTDKKAPAAIRNQAQSLVVMLTQGLGLGLGAQLFGRWTAMCTSGDTIDFSKFWYVPAGFAFVVMILFALFFWDKVDKKTDLEEVAVAASPDEESAM